jgi:integrase
MVTIIRSKTDGAMIGETKLLPFLEDKSICPVEIYNRYASMVPSQTGRLFLTWRKTKFINSPVGKNTIAKYPSRVAKFLGLSEPKKYTGHAWRSTSATVLADSGASQLDLKRAGSWKSDTVAKGYL